MYILSTCHNDKNCILYVTRWHRFIAIVWHNNKRSGLSFCCILLQRVCPVTMSYDFSGRWDPAVSFFLILFIIKIESLRQHSNDCTWMIIYCLVLIRHFYFYKYVWCDNLNSNCYIIAEVMYICRNVQTKKVNRHSFEYSKCVYATIYDKLANYWHKPLHK